VALENVGGHVGISSQQLLNVKHIGSQILNERIKPMEVVHLYIGFNEFVSSLIEGGGGI
jgi:hypothetical protein